MALQTNIKINGIPVSNAYISISKSRTEKQYQKQEDGTIVQGFVTWVHIGGAVNATAWANGDRFNLNHVVALNGELTRDSIYPQLKTMTFPEYELDLTQAIDV